MSATLFLATQGMDVVGIDNDLRRYFFGDETSNQSNRGYLERSLKNYRHFDDDIRNHEAVNAIFRQHQNRITLVVHTAAQPSHDWAAREPATDFAVNATATLNLLETTRRHCPNAVFIFVSTNKVYGDTPNRLPFIEQETRWEVSPEHLYASEGIDECMNIDLSLHSLFGASKLSADVLVQEYGRYFGMRTACFRCGCITGPMHSGAVLHGFLAYLIKCAAMGTACTIFGHRGKQVRDNLHVNDLTAAFWECFLKPPIAAVYNMGGGRFANCSILEAIQATERIVGRRMRWSYKPEARLGDHIWWITDTSKFREHYPRWQPKYDIDKTIAEIADAAMSRCGSPVDN
jgi:CDP-paratose 2-epimerase